MVPGTGAVEKLGGLLLIECWGMRNDSSVRGGLFGTKTRHWDTEELGRGSLTTKVTQPDFLSLTFFRGAEKLSYHFHDFAVTYWH